MICFVEVVDIESKHMQQHICQIRIQRTAKTQSCYNRFRLMQSHHWLKKVNKITPPVLNAS